MSQSQKARVQHLERKAGARSVDEFGVLMTRDGGQSYTDDAGRVYSRAEVDQLVAEGRLVRLRWPEDL